MVNHIKFGECGHAASIFPSVFQLQERKGTVGMTSSFWDIPGIKSQPALEFIAGLLDPICVYNDQGQAIYTSPSFLALLQTQLEEVHFFDYFQSEATPLTALKTMWAQVHQGDAIEFHAKSRDSRRLLKCSLHFHPDSQLTFLKVTPLQQPVAAPSFPWCQLFFPSSSLPASFAQSFITIYEQISSALFYHPNLATALIRADGILSQGNQKLYNLLGIEAHELIDFETWVHPEDRGIDTELRQKLLDGVLSNYTIEKRLITRNQETIWVNASISRLTLLQPVNGYTTYLVALLEDITETKKIYSALIRTEGKWKSFVLNSHNLFLQTSSAGRILYTSPAVERVLGYQEEELLDLHVSQLIHPEDLNEFNLAMHLWSKGMASNPTGIECRWKTQTGNWAYLSVQGKQFPLALDMEGIVISGYDITDRKQLEIQLRLSEEKYRSLVANLPDAILRYDTTYTLEFVSQSIESITGYTATDFISERCRSYLSIVCSEDIELIQDSVLESLLNHRPCSLEYRILHADGSIRWVSEHRKGVFDDHHQLLYFDSILSDITDRKQTEDYLRQSEAVNQAIAQVVPKRLSESNNISESNDISESNNISESNKLSEVNRISEINNVDRHSNCIGNPPCKEKNAYRLF